MTYLVASEVLSLLATPCSLLKMLEDCLGAGIGSLGTVDSGSGSGLFGGSKPAKHSYTNCSCNL